MDIPYNFQPRRDINMERSSSAFVEMRSAMTVFPVQSQVFPLRFKCRIDISASDHIRLSDSLDLVYEKRRSLLAIHTGEYLCVSTVNSNGTTSVVYYPPGDMQWESL